MLPDASMNGETRGISLSLSLYIYKLIIYVICVICVCIYIYIYVDISISPPQSWQFHAGLVTPAAKAVRQYLTGSA